VYSQRFIVTMADQYKLTYFNARGAAETIRYIFALAGVDYDDVRIEKDQWPSLKPTTKWGQVPFIEVNGVQMAQSVAIGRYLARKYKLVGESSMEEFQCDEIIDAFGDLKPHMRPIFMEQDEEKKKVMKAEVISTHVKPFLAKLNVLKEKNGGSWMVGRNVSWADVHTCHNLDYLSMWDPNVLNEYPALKALKDSFFTLPAIQKWVEKRPVTTM